MKGRIKFPPPLFKKNPEDKNDGWWEGRFDPETLAQISAIKEATKLQRKARAASDTTKPKQINQTGSWLVQKAQDKSAAPKGKAATGAVEKTTLYPLGVKLLNYSRTKDDDDTQFHALGQIIAQQDKSERNKCTTGDGKNTEEHADLFGNSDSDWGLGFNNRTTSPLSLQGGSESGSMDVDYSSEEKEQEAIKASCDKGEEEFTGDIILNGGQGDKNEPPLEMIIAERKPILTQQGIMDLIEHQASSKRSASSAG